jgi:hypothetical protein
MFVNKHGAYTILSHVCTQKKKKSLLKLDYKVQIFVSMNVSFKEMKDSQHLLLVPRLKMYNVVIQSLNIISLHQHYLQHDHNLQISHILCHQETRVKETSHFDMTKYNHIYVFDNHDNILMYNNNVTLQLCRAVMHIRSWCIATTFNSNTGKAICVTSFTKVLEIRHELIIVTPKSCPTIVFCTISSLIMLIAFRGSLTSPWLLEFYQSQTSIFILPQHNGFIIWWYMHECPW